jgi:CPA1 family monovalent cation:H+ antiporter
MQARIGNTRARAGDGPVLQPSALTERDVRSDLLAAENAELTRLYDEGAISAATRRQFQQALDLEAARLSGGQR